MTSSRIFDVFSLANANEVMSTQAQPLEQARVKTHGPQLPESWFWGLHVVFAAVILLGIAVIARAAGPRTADALREWKQQRENKNGEPLSEV